MFFSDSPQLKAMERLMTAVPRFRPKGGGLMAPRSFAYTAEMCDCGLCLYFVRKEKCTATPCPCIEERIIAGVASHAEIMAETMKNVHNAAFHKRLNQFIRESEELHMNFKNGNHRQAFNGAIRKVNKQDYALLSVLYLLTADHKLWMQVRNFVEKNGIRFSSFKPRDSTEQGYTMYCCAKDLYLGTKHISISDLADTELIAPKTFALICNAMAIRRFGLGTLECNERNKQSNHGYSILTQNQPDG